MKQILIAVFVYLCAPVLAAAPEKVPVESLQAGIQKLQSELQAANSSLSALNAAVQTLTGELRTYYGGLEYVLMAIVQAFYFGLGLALFYIFDRGRLARDAW